MVYWKKGGRGMERRKMFERWEQPVVIRPACPRDIEGWMALVCRVKDDFPGLESAEGLREHREATLRFMQNGSALCAVRGEHLVGALLFAKEAGALCFLAVDPACRRQHIGKKLVSFLLAQMDDGKDVAVTTYREDDPRGAAARAFYKRLGFSEGRLGEEFGCPVQEFTLKR